MTAADVNEFCRKLVVDAGELAIPALDCVSNDEEDVEALGDIFMVLSSYCRIKAVAMRNRKAGDIPLAMKQERLCDNLYKKLPSVLRW